MSKKLSVKDLDLDGKRVLVRVDFNVPIEDGEIQDDTRIVAALPTIKYIIENGGKAILASHLGRPEGFDSEFTLAPVAERLGELLEKRVKFVPDCIGAEVSAVVSEMENGGLLLLENTRFYHGETENDPEFAEKLAELADLYVNDAFGTAHRAHASTYGVTKFIEKCAAGFLMQSEIEQFEKLMTNPERPFIAILGGVKISDKIGVLKNLMKLADELIIGGGMTYTFFKAEDIPIGDSVVEEDKVDLAVEILKEASDKNVPLHLPVDNVIADEFAADANSKVVGKGAIPDGWEGLDIGPKSIEKFGVVIKKAKTIFWNGPLGGYEFDKFAKGTMTIAQMVADSDATTVIGGGDCVAAVKKAGVEQKIDHVSTGGGASLTYLEGGELPGIAALTDKL